MIHRLASTINAYCDQYQYFWAYGILAETASLWGPKSSYNLLCDDAKHVLKTVRLVKKIRG